jgi:anti-sigma B factor antagonist
MRMLSFYTDQAVDDFAVDTLPDRERVIVAPRGELDTATVGRVAAEMDALVRVGFVELVLDLRGVRFMDAAGLRLVVTQARRADAKVELIDGPPAVSRLFALARLRAELPFLSPREITRRRYHYTGAE